ncbi:CYTH domain-containing protein [Bacillus solitudinis]|uniref:CYTH domain-containing protein n=1 Tax=Bacillus solitudinis TaxID=2014074 RepID=UPI000C23730A|nr:CYTH domain-containing protein [Bacillus solitudinis]
MTQEIEIEVKTLLSEEAFKEILSAFNLTDQDAIVQHNHYFETDDFSLKSKHAALRIREKSQMYTLTLKQPHQEEGLLETHQELTKDEMAQALGHGVFPYGPVSVQLEALQIDISKLTYLGFLSTARIEIDYNSGSLCFDKSSYLDVIDYEIEFEGTSLHHAESTIEALLIQFNLTRQNPENKVQRFFKRKALKNK